VSEGGFLRVRILGCGSSGGVPRVDGDWGDCDPANPKNHRYRCSLLLERAVSLDKFKAGKITRVLVDTSPDLRSQLLAAGVTSLDGVIYTHTHADQCHGIDDVRAIVYRQAGRLPAYASSASAKELLERFDYIFETPPGSSYPPLMAMHDVSRDVQYAIEGAGGPLAFSLFDVQHGGAPCSGVRAGPLAYTPDVNGLDGNAFASLEGASVWIVDALRDKPHPSHAHVAMTLDWLKRVKPVLGVLTNLHIDLDYRKLLGRCPAGVRPAYDGMSLLLNEQSGEVINVDRP